MSQAGNMSTVVICNEPKTQVPDKAQPVGNHLFQLRAFACYMMDSAGGVRAHTVVAHASESVFHFLCSIVTQTASRDLRDFSLPSLRKLLELYLWLCEAMDSIPFENHNSK